LTVVRLRRNFTLQAEAQMDTIKTMLATCRKWKDSRQVAAVAAYEDSHTDARTAEFCRCLARQLGQQCELSKQMWLLNELRIPNLRTIAADEAAKADLVIISLHHGPSLPVEIIDWIDQWLPHKRRRPTVLLALFDPVYEGDSASMQTYLAQVAKKGAMEFLVHSEELTQDS
jgi:hypothetical protein